MSFFSKELFVSYVDNFLNLKIQYRLSYIIITIYSKSPLCEVVNSYS